MFSWYKFGVVEVAVVEDGVGVGVGDVDGVVGK